MNSTSLHFAWIVHKTIQSWNVVTSCDSNFTDEAVTCSSFVKVPYVPVEKRNYCLQEDNEND